MKKETTKKINKFINKFRFKDEGGTPCGFKWWWKWTNAKRHWYQWLRYEGMSENITDTDKMHKWNRDLIKWQDGEDVKGFPKHIKPKYNVVSGHHRVKAAKDIGLKKINVKI